MNTSLQNHIKAAETIGRKSAIARHNNDENSAQEHFRYLNKIINLYNLVDGNTIRKAYEEAYKEEMQSYQPLWDYRILK